MTDALRFPNRNRVRFTPGRRQFIVGLPIILLFWLVLGGLPILTLGLLGLDRSPLGVYLSAGLSFAALLAGLTAAMWGVHYLPLRRLVANDMKVHWLRVAGAGLVWLALLGAVTGIWGLLQPGTVRQVVDWGRWSAAILPLIAFTIVQATAEELFFRGYLLRTLRRVLDGRRRAMVISALIFALAHGVGGLSGLAAMGQMGACFLFGLLMACLAGRDHRLESPIGIHIVNNLFFLLIIDGVGQGTPITGSALYTIAGGALPLIIIALFIGLILVNLRFSFSGKLHHTFTAPARHSKR